jgi:uncharacterized membrane protein
MTEIYQHSSSPANNSLRQTLVLGAHRVIFWFSKHWLAVTNTFFFLYVGLPFLAPILLARGFAGPANAIYSFYHIACHQFPARSYYIFGEQVAFCHRDVAIYGSLFLGGVGFAFVRHRLKPPALRWYVFFLVPIALDAGMAMASELLASGVPMLTLWAIGLIAMGLTSAVLNSQNYLTWHSFLFFAFGPLALIYLQYFGPYHTDVWRRNLTGFIFGIGTVWYAYPYLEATFNNMRQEIAAKLAKATQRA